MRPQAADVESHSNKMLERSTKRGVSTGDQNNSHRYSLRELWQTIILEGPGGSDWLSEMFTVLLSSKETCRVVMHRGTEFPP